MGCLLFLVLGILVYVASLAGIVSFLTSPYILLPLGIGMILWGRWYREELTHWYPCPYCKTRVRDDMLKCKACHSNLDEEEDCNECTITGGCSEHTEEEDADIKTDFDK